MSALLPLIFAPSYILYSVVLRPSLDAPPPGLIAACILRLFHYFITPLRERYSYALPITCALLLLYEFSLLHAHLARPPAPRAAAASPFSSAAAARIKDHVRGRGPPERTILDLSPGDIWRWTDLPSYLLFTCGGVILLLFLTALFLPRPPAWYAACLCGAAVACEATQCVPRVLGALSGTQQRASYLGLLAALVCLGALLGMPRAPSLFALSSGLALACEVLVLASAELTLLFAPRGTGGGRAAKAV